MGLLLALALLDCGYRPAGRLVDDEHRTALVPAFRSEVTYPELDVYAGTYLSSRLTAMGMRPSSDPSHANVTVQGHLLAAEEQVLVLGSSQTLVELVVDVQIAVLEQAGPGYCQTAVARGRATFAVPFTTDSETQRQAALQSATSEAIDVLLLETLSCLDTAVGG